ncbi:DUF4357 domain-containing protein [Arthrobacter sp. U41]|uniref:DUF4357 domain-containing protein n=1 Tax=Arthrobacter sp. U41 TaxID=1849032 RepID=UPI0011A38DCF|nr:DUF4357 domain-containing protein [Arthrobacter sp. U41]
MMLIESLVFDLEDAYDNWKLSMWPDGLALIEGRSGTYVGAWTGQLPLRRVLHIFSVVSTFTEIDEPTIEAIPRKNLMRILVAFANEDSLPLSLNVNLDEAGAVIWSLRQMIAGLVREGHWYPTKGYQMTSGAGFAGATRFRLSTKNADANALINATGIVVLAGSRASTVTASSLSTTLKTLRERMVEWEMWEPLNDDQYVVNRHMFFPSPLQAASVLCGSPTNGFDMWVDQAGTTLRNLGDLN